MEKQKIVGVKFEGANSGKIYYFSPNNLDLKLNDSVIVETSMGLSMGTVALDVREIDEAELVEPLKKVIRKATEKDFQTKHRLTLREKTAVEEAKKLSQKLKLDMSIISSEFTFDESKVIINFTAENRVDFRELVKMLAGVLKTRIELRQVGARDKAKLLGGIGPCGRELCCKKFLSDFEKVNIKMAKNQNVSLSPSNINGLCGKLKCCLAYENEQYIELINKMPKLSSKVKTKDGEGVVVYNDLLKQIVSVKIVKQDDNFEINDYNLSDIEVLEKANLEQPKNCANCCKNQKNNEKSQKNDENQGK